MAKRRGNNEGSIHKRPNGTWRALITIDGKRLSFNGKSRRECQEWIRDTLMQKDAGLTFVGAQTNLSEYLNQWMVISEGSLIPSTSHHYRQVLRDHVMPYIGDIRLNDLRPAHLESLYKNAKDRGVGLRTIQLTHAVVRRALNQAVDTGLLLRNPASHASPPKYTQSEMRVYDEVQTQSLLSAARLIGDRYFTLYHLAVTTGMRQSELLGLNWSDLDWSKRVITIKRQLKRINGGGFELVPPKTKAGRRSVNIGLATIEILREHEISQFEEMKEAGKDWDNSGLLFTTSKGTPIDKYNLIKKFKKVIAFANLPPIRFHDLRHTAASLMLNYGIPVIIVSKRLGHAKPSTTLDVYGHLIPSMQEEAAELMDELVTPVKIQIAP